MAYTISTQNGSGSAHREHNIRNKKVIEKENAEFNHVDLDGKMEVWKDERERDAYKRIFGEALEKYNEGKQKCRRIPDYYDHVRKSKNLKTGWEMIIQVGNTKSHPSEEVCHEILKKFTDGWNERNPNLELIGAYYHADEITGPHVHLDYVPVASGYKTGLELQASMDRALKNMGFSGTHMKDTPLIRWQARENAELERICKEHGLEIEHPLTGEKHLNIKHYRLLKDIENENAELTKLYIEKEELLKDYEVLQEKNRSIGRMYEAGRTEYEELRGEYDILFGDLGQKKEELEVSTKSLEEAEKRNAELEAALKASQEELLRIENDIRLTTASLEELTEDVEKKYKSIDKDSFGFPHIQPGESNLEYEERVKEYIKNEHIMDMHAENMLSQKSKEYEIKIDSLESELMEFRNLLNGKDIHYMEKELKTIRAFRDGLEHIEKTDEVRGHTEFFNRVVHEQRARVKALNRDREKTVEIEQAPDIPKEPTRKDRTHKHGKKKTQELSH